MIAESELEHSCLSCFAALGYEVLDPDHLEPSSVYDERNDLTDVILKGRLVAALERLNQNAPPEALDEAIRRILRHDAPTLEQNNYDFHRLLNDGITVEVAAPQGGVRGIRIGRTEVDVGVVGGDPPFLRTFANDKWTDNLLSLPRF